MRITTRKPRQSWTGDRWSNTIMAYSDQGHRLEIPYPYWTDDPHWVVAFRLARYLKPESEIKKVSWTQTGVVYVV